jgi:hypothetical protein
VRPRTDRNNSRRIPVAARALAALTVAFAAVSIGVLSASAGEEPPNERVTLCHATASQTNPYNLITVDENAIANVILGMNGHATHTGGIFPEPGWGDIIPAFDIPPNSFGGLNNTAEGLAILENGCEPVTPPTTGPPTTGPPTTGPPRTAPPTQPPREAAPAAPGAPTAPRAPGAPAAAPGAAAAPSAPSAAAVPAQPLGVTG